MKRYFILTVILSVLSSCAISPASSPLDEKASSALIRRVLPTQADCFRIEYLPSDEGKDNFELESRDGKIILRGNNGVSIASALNYYIENCCLREYPWDCPGITLQEPLPEIQGVVRKTSPYEYRHYFNYCTFNYTASWWDWKRWQREIDYLAMHGINMPMALTGQNIVWDKVYRELGFSRKELEDFFTGPAYFIWFWMGNMDGWGGPLSRHFMRKQARLQKKILARERSLGMTPVLPSFTGHVPPSFAEKFPDAKVNLVQWGEGCNIAPPTNVLDPEEDMFSEIGRRFLEEQTRLFGTDHLYSADTFNEMTPPTNDSTYLAGISRRVYESMQSVDPEATWVMQGWMFFDRAWFWQPTQMKALFSAVPEDRLIVLDLWSEKHPVWDRTDAFYGQKWIWNMLHNFGGRLSVYGDMEIIAEGPSEALNGSASGKLSGIGLTMEATGQNPAIYSLMLDNVWRSEAIDPDEWIRDYAVRRYGTYHPQAVHAWEILRRTAYDSQPAYGNVSIISGIPTLEDESVWTFTWCPYDQALFLDAVDSLAACAALLQGSEGYRYDLVNMVRQVLANYSNHVQQRLAIAYADKDIEAWNAAKEEFLELIDDMDELLGTHPDFLLGKWLSDARSQGFGQKEKDLFEMNARDLITLWTGPDCTIHEYASKEWSGLIKGFYKPRWQMFFDEMEKCRDENIIFDGNAFDQRLCNWEWEWVHKHDRYNDKAVGDCIPTAIGMLNKYSHRVKESYVTDNS